MKERSALTITLLTLVLCNTIRAQLADPVPMDETTCAILAIDLDKADIPAAMKLLADAVNASGLPKAEQEALIAQLREEQVPELTRQREALLAAGAKRVLVVSSLSYLPDGYAILAIPLDAGMDEANIPGEKIGNARILAPPALIRRLRETPPLPRPEMAEALVSAAKDSSMVLVFAPSEGTREVFAEMLPELPPEAGGGSTRPITHGMRWMVASIRFAPEPSVQLDVAARDADAAQSIANMLREILKAPALRGVQLDPKVDGAHVRAALRGQPLRQSLTPVVAAIAGARMQALSVHSARNLRQLGQSMLIYANNHKGQFPATLEEAIASNGVDRSVLKNPRAPQREAGYVYVRPELPEDKQYPPADAVLAYESYDQWPAGGVWVLFGDGHAELIGDEGTFKNMLENTPRRPEAPAPPADRR